jgi:hypothetical protein
MSNRITLVDTHATLRGAMKNHTDNDMFPELIRGMILPQSHAIRQRYKCRHKAGIGGGGMPRGSNDCINRESYDGGHVLVGFVVSSRSQT